MSKLDEPINVPNTHLATNLLDLVEPTKPEETSVPSKPHKRIILMGATGAGKSTFINTAAGAELAVGNHLVSCTQNVVSVPLQLEDGTLVELIDTPGFDDTVRSDFEILEEIAMALRDWDNIYGVVYVYRISDIRMSGSARQTYNAFCNVCGKDAMPRSSIVTNMWGGVSTELGQAREKELLDGKIFFKPAVQSGVKYYRHDGSKDSSLQIVRDLARGPKPVELLIQTELRRAQGDLLQTTAGRKIDEELAKSREKHEQELASIGEEYAQALQRRDTETQEELEEERQRVQAQIDRMQSVRRQLEEKATSRRPPVLGSTTVTHSKPNKPDVAFYSPQPASQRPIQTPRRSNTEYGREPRVAYERAGWEVRSGRDDSVIATHPDTHGGLWDMAKGLWYGRGSETSSEDKMREELDKLKKRAKKVEKQNRANSAKVVALCGEIEDLRAEPGQSVKPGQAPAGRISTYPEIVRSSSPAPLDIVRPGPARTGTHPGHHAPSSEQAHSSKSSSRR